MRSPGAHTLVLGAVLCVAAGCSEDRSAADQGPAGPRDATASDMAPGGDARRSDAPVAGKDTGRDTRADASPPLPIDYAVSSAGRSGTRLSHPADAWKDVLTRGVRVYSGGGRWLLILNVPETWNDKRLGTSWFAIAVDGKNVAQGGYAGGAGQRMPLTLVSVESLARGYHTVTARWRSPTRGATAYIGATGAVSLIAMKAPSDVQASSLSGTPRVVSTSAAGGPIGLADLKLTVKTKAHYLYLLNVPDVTNDAARGWTWYTIWRDKVALARGGTIQQAAANWRMPATVAAVEELAPGGYTIRATGAAAPGTKSTIGAAGTSSLVALRLPAGAAFRRRKGRELSATSTTYTAISDLGKVDVTSRGDRHLLMFVAPDTWNTVAGGGPWFSLDVDGASVGRATYTSGANGQRVSASLITTAAMKAGRHAVTMRWKHQGPGTATLGRDSDTWLIALR